MVCLSFSTRDHPVYTEIVKTIDLLYSFGVFPHKLTCRTQVNGYDCAAKEGADTKTYPFCSSYGPNTCQFSFM